jgi:hypothetical protein
MEPNFKLLLDEMTSLNRRFDEQGDQWGRGFSDLQRGLTDLERGLTDRSTSINFRLDALEASQSVNSDALAHRIAVLESASMGSANTAMVSRLATLEASYTDRDAKFTNRISELEALRVSPTQDDRDRVVTIEAATADLTSWRPGVEGMLDDVCIAVRKLEKSRERELFDEMSHGPGLLPTPTKAVVHFSAGFPAEPPVMGHRVDSTTRDLGSGVVMTWIPVPANGMIPTPKSPVVRSSVLGPCPPPVPPRPTFHPASIAHPPPCPPPPDPPHHANFDPHHHGHPIGRLPKVPFPQFDGDNPQRWRTRAEKYFGMYNVEEFLWISISEMHFDGATSLCYQSIESQVPDLSWSNFCKLMMDRFDRDRHESLIR